MSVAGDLHRRGAAAPDVGDWDSAPVVTAASGPDVLIAAALGGDGRAWESLVDRYQPLVNAVGRQFRLHRADADDLSQALWLRVYEHLHELRVPDALPGWISATARREAIRMTNSGARTRPVDPAHPVVSGGDRSPDVEELVLLAERRRAVRAGLAELTPQQRELLVLLVSEPGLSYQQISRRLEMPVGSLGPKRARCLRRLAATAAVRALLT